jgi:transcriptional regulator with XRE-family HTH domain
MMGTFLEAGAELMGDAQFETGYREQQHASANSGPHGDEYSRLGLLLRFTREQHDISIAEIAERTELSPEYVWALEAGRVEPSDVTLEHLSVLGRALDQKLVITMVSPQTQLQPFDDAHSHVHDGHDEQYAFATPVLEQL